MFPGNIYDLYVQCNDPLNQEVCSHSSFVIINVRHHLLNQLVSITHAKNSKCKILLHSAVRHEDTLLVMETAIGRYVAINKAINH